MSVLCISISEKGVLRVDVLFAGANDYPRAADFHRELAPEIARLDRIVRNKRRIKPEDSTKTS